MRFWSRQTNKKSSLTRTSTLTLERLEDRQLLAANTIAFESGETVRFVDSDGTRVSVKLLGPGSGTLDLTNGQLTGGNIENLTLTGTTSASQLKITANGGRIGGTRINELVIEKALNQLTALNRLVATKVDFVDGGSLTADGHVGDIEVRRLGASAQIEVAGNVGRLKTKVLDENASVEVSGSLLRFNAVGLNAGSTVSAEKLDSLKLDRVNGAKIEVGAGGLLDAKINHLYYSAIASQGDIGRVLVQGNMIGSTVACNINAGSDGNYGTIDDHVNDPTASGDIKNIRVKGKVGSVPGQTVAFIASGSIDNMNLGARNRNVAPIVLEQAASQNIPLDFDATALSNLFGEGEIWVAVYGEVIAAGATSGSSYYLDPARIVNGEGLLTATSTLPAPSATTPNLVTLPSATLATWGNAINLRAPIMPGEEFSGRILISVGAPVQAQVNADGTISAPSASNPTDPSTGTFYDFLEFTVKNNSGTINLDIDTSQVDAFGLPIGLEFFQDAAGTEQFSVNFTGTATASSPTISGISNADILKLSLHQAVSGPNIPTGARIIGIDVAGGTVTLDANATPTPPPVTNATFTAYTGGPVGVKAQRDVIVSGNTHLALMQYLLNQINGGNDSARPFLQTAAPFVKTGPVPITYAAGSSPMTITTDSVEGLAAGSKIWIEGVEGNTWANGWREVTSVDTANKTFQVNAESNAAYTSGGTWHMNINGASHAPNTPITITASNTLGLQNGDLIEISGAEGNTAANGFFIVSNVTPTSFQLVGSQGNGLYTTGGRWKVYTTGNRIASPKDIVESLSSPQDTNELNNYFNAAVDAFFMNYYQGAGGSGNQFQIQSAVNGYTYSGYTESVNINYTVGKTAYTYSGYALHLTSTSDPGNDYYIIYPFFTTNTPSNYAPQLTPAAPPSWITAAGQQLESASRMIFACDAVFADNVARGLTGNPSKVQGDLEDSISAAFNRGISDLTPSEWDDTTKWFPTNGTYNYWVEFWHQTGLMHGDLAYAFPFDDKFGASTNLSQNTVGLARITLGSWTGTTIDSTTAITSIPASAQLQGPISLTAQVTATNTLAHPLTGTVTFYINGVPINENDFSANPPVQQLTPNGSGVVTINATLPVMPDGNAPHTYVVSAVYSGDLYRAPSIATQTLPLTPAFSLGFGTNPVPFGQNFTATATIGTSTVTGTVDFSILFPHGGEMPLASEPATTTTQATLNIPTDFLQFTGNIVTSGGKSTITNVSSFEGIAAGQTVWPASPTALTLGAPQPHQFYLSQPSSVTGNVDLTVNGRTFPVYILPSNPKLVQNVDQIFDLKLNDVVTGIGILQNTTISAFIPGNIPLTTPTTAATNVLFTSNGAGAAFTIKVTYKPTTGPWIYAYADIGIVA